MALDLNDTIVAISSPPGPGHRGIVRATGPHAFSLILDDLVDPPNPSQLERPRRVEGLMKFLDQGPPLPVAVSLWPGSKTYTGQPMVEIHSSGSGPILRAMLHHCLGRGARLAEPGEFTLRSFLNGRIDLTRAEAVLGVIDAQTPAQLAGALEQLAGGVANLIVRLRDRMTDLLAHLEANLDFAEESDVSPVGVENLARSLGDAAAEVDQLSDRLRQRDRASTRLRVVLVGPPNAGKSRLYNALLGYDRAIVSPLAGTTRDYIEAPCDCDGLMVDLVDTAGEESPDDLIEARAQELRDAQYRLADLRLICVPANESLPAQLASYGATLNLVVRTKADLLVDGLGQVDGAIESVVTSVSSGQGIGELRQAIARILRDRGSENDLPSGTAARCGHNLLRARDSLTRAAEATRLKLGDELVAADVRQALDELGQVVGEVVTDDILDRIFRQFCIGK